ncbi:hypothetical protein ABZ470_00585 [Streptosporangium sp. NPDC020072]|uniref:hypothetical protein n=1 Tax=Streptosporangium sp. NPDC020072 TaxID=3154788 RepID=UPI003436B28D
MAKRKRGGPSQTRKVTRPEPPEADASNPTATPAGASSNKRRLTVANVTGVVSALAAVIGLPISVWAIVADRDDPSGRTTTSRTAPPGSVTPDSSVTTERLPPIADGVYHIRTTGRYWLILGANFAFTRLVEGKDRLSDYSAAWSVTENPERENEASIRYVSGPPFDDYGYDSKDDVNKLSWNVKDDEGDPILSYSEGRDWNIVPLPDGSGYWITPSYGGEFCLTSKGQARELVLARCQMSSKLQQWHFVPVGEATAHE